MKIKLKVQISGTRDGVDWPTPGGTLDVSTDEAKSLIGAGIAVAISDEKAIEPEPVVETATAPKPETATTKTRAPRAPKGK